MMTSASYDRPIRVNELQAGAPSVPTDLVVWPYPLRVDELADSFGETVKARTGVTGCVLLAEHTGNGVVCARRAVDVPAEHLSRLASVLAAEKWASWDESDPITVSIDDLSFGASVVQPWVVRVRSHP